MQIKYLDLEVPSQSSIAKSGSEAPVLRIDRGNTLDQFVYEILAEEPNYWPVGKTRYWTNTSGFTTATTYLGVVPIEIVEIPEWVG